MSNNNKKMKGAHYEFQPDESMDNEAYPTTHSKLNGLNESVELHNMSIRKDESFQMDPRGGVGGGAYLGLEKDSFAMDDSMMYASPGRFEHDPNSSMQIVEETRTPGNPYGVEGDRSLALGVS